MKVPFKSQFLKDMIELDTYGYSDHSIELSSDEEEAPGDGVSATLIHGRRKDKI